MSLPVIESVPNPASTYNVFGTHGGWATCSNSGYFERC